MQIYNVLDLLTLKSVIIAKNLKVMQITIYTYVLLKSNTNTECLNMYFRVI
mgnify:CR=1 FL=1